MSSIENSLFFPCYEAIVPWRPVGKTASTTRRSARTAPGPPAPVIPRLFSALAPKVMVCRVYSARTTGLGRRTRKIILRCRILGSRLRGWTDQRDRADPVKTLSRWALSAWMRLGWLPCVDEHHDRRAGRLDWLRGPSRPGFGPRAAEVHDYPMGRGAPRVRLLDPARNNASAPRWPTMVIHMPTDGKTGHQTSLA